MKKNVVFVTGTRADFGKLKPLASGLIEHDFSVTFFVTGMHMMKKYGLTKVEVNRVPNARIVEHLNQRENDSQDIILAKTVLAFSDFLQEEKPDLVVIHGDRIEALGCAIVCATNNQLSAHIEGGEVSGTIDDVFRHSVSKLCSHHFVSSKRAAERLVALGEEPSRIYAIGSPELDYHAVDGDISLKEVKDYYNIPFADFGICIFHPVTTEVDSMAEQADTLFSALQESGRNFIVIMPNNDPGHLLIEASIKALPKARFHILPSMRFEYFSKLLKETELIVGNSSIGVREAPFLGVGTINVGTRQNGRASSPSVKNILASNKMELVSLINANWGKKYKKSEEFGEGKAIGKFVKTLSSDWFWETSLQKYYHDTDDLKLKLV